MNERIYELFEQALKEFKQEHEYATYIVPDPIKEKFAELIVRECTDFLKDTLDDHFAAEQLEEHFGVEELQQPIDFETQDPETAKGTKVKHFGVEE